MTVRRRVLLQAGGVLFLGGCAEAVAPAAGPTASPAPTGAQVPPARPAASASASATPSAAPSPDVPRYPLGEDPTWSEGRPAPPSTRSADQLKRDLAKAEAEVRAVAAKVGGRFGLYAVDTSNENHVAIDADARFAMASTFKALLAGAILVRAEAGQLSLDQKLPISKADLQAHAPVIKARLAEKELSIRDLCAAIVEVSDNGAANVLIAQVGGPAGLTAFLRGIGDSVTRCDRTEPALNTNVPGDERDTTTPRAMAESIRRICLGNVLPLAARRTLLGWMKNSQTGARRIRAGLPDGWQGADKTGTGENMAVNDVAIALPSGGSPVILAIYTTGSKAKLAEVEQAHADAAYIVARALV